MSVCCCSLAGTAACQHCASNPFATDVYSNAITTDRIVVKPKTNADRIRAMTDEEMAEWLAYGSMPQEVRKMLNNGAFETNSDAFLWWLKQEVSE